MHFAEVGGADDVACHRAVLAQRRDEGADDHQARLAHQLGHLGDTADVLAPILGAEAQAATQAGANGIAVQHRGRHAGVLQARLQGRRQRGLAGAGQAGQPKHSHLMRRHLLAALAAAALRWAMAASRPAIRASR